MTLKFTVEITMGNAAMQTPDDITAALTRLSGSLHGLGQFDPITDTTWIGGNCFDENGNNVGSWAIHEYCDQCEEKIERNDMHAGYGMCGSCLHDAIRSGWTAPTCIHCGREITRVRDRWIDPEATGDDAIWRETCDANDTERAAPHEPKED